jgi:hypothetical protein
MSRLGIININGDEYDLDDLDIGEMEEIEILAEAPFSEINAGSAKGMKAFVFVLLKRNNPEITMEEIKKVKMVSMMPPEESMPELPPDGRADQESQNQVESQRDDSGPLRSVDSIPG